MARSSRSVTITLAPGPVREQAQRAAQEILTDLTELSAELASDAAPRRSGFLADSIHAVPPNSPGRQASSGEPIPDAAPRHTVASPATGPQEAYVAASAEYALFVELETPFLQPTVAVTATRLSGIVRGRRIT